MNVQIKGGATRWLGRPVRARQELLIQRGQTPAKLSCLLVIGSSDGSGDTEGRGWRAQDGQCGRILVRNEF